MLYLTVAVNGKFQETSGTTISGSIGFNYANTYVELTTTTTAMSILYGGDPKFTDFVLSAGDPANAKELYESWKSTLIENPVGVRYDE